MEIRYDFDTGALYMQLAIYGNDAHREVEITPTCFAGITRNGRVCHITLTKPREPWPIKEILWRFASMPKETKAILELLAKSAPVEPPMTVGAALLAGMPIMEIRDETSYDPRKPNCLRCGHVYNQHFSVDCHVVDCDCSGYEWDAAHLDPHTRNGF